MKRGNNKRILKLSDTAALVMSWSIALYKKGWREAISTALTYQRAMHF